MRNNNLEGDYHLIYVDLNQLGGGAHTIYKFEGFYYKLSVYRGGTPSIMKAHQDLVKHLIDNSIPKYNRHFNNLDEMITHIHKQFLFKLN